MNNAEPEELRTIVRNARLIRPQVRGQSRGDRWQTYARLIMGEMWSGGDVNRIWIDDELVFDAEFEGTWAAMRKTRRAEAR